MSDRFNAIPRAVFNTASITGSYQSLNGAGFSAPIKMLKIYNAGTQGIDISYDGVTDHDYYPGGATIIVDLQANHENSSSFGSGTYCGVQGQIIYGKGTAGAGNLYIIGYQ